MKNIKKIKIGDNERNSTVFQWAPARMDSIIILADKINEIIDALDELAKEKSEK